MPSQNNQTAVNAAQSQTIIAFNAGNENYVFRPEIMIRAFQQLEPKMGIENLDIKFTELREWLLDTIPDNSDINDIKQFREFMWMADIFSNAFSMAVTPKELTD